jgi:hypothetical protein
MLSVSTPAVAVGTASVDMLIPKDLVHGWKLVPGSELSSTIATATKDASKGTGQRVRGASEGWISPSKTEDVIAVLLDFPKGVPGATEMVQQFDFGACDSSTGDTKEIVRPYAKIHSSQEAECAGKDSGGTSISSVVISWVRGNYFVGVESINVSASAVNGVARTFDLSLGNSTRALNPQSG